jgi:hypothetical protein
LNDARQRGLIVAKSPDVDEKMRDLTAESENIENRAE